jgi:hypothetical protein
MAGYFLFMIIQAVFYAIIFKNIIPRYRNLYG